MGDPGLAARCQQHGLTRLPLLAGQGEHQPSVPRLSQRDPDRNDRTQSNRRRLRFRRNVRPSPGCEGSPRCPRRLRAAAEARGRRCDDGLQSALTGSSILVRAGRGCPRIHQSIIPQTALPESILIPFPPRVTAPPRRHRGVNLTTQGH